MNMNRKEIFKKIQGYHLFSKIKSFNFFVYLLGKKEKSLRNELKIKEELIVHYKDRIKFHSTMIGIHEDNIKTLEIENRKIERNIDNIKKVKKV